MFASQDLDVGKCQEFGEQFLRISRSIYIMKNKLMNLFSKMTIVSILYLRRFGRCQTVSYIEIDSFGGYIGINASQRQTWFEAETYCNNTYGTHLASIHNETDNVNAFKSIHNVTDHTKWAWIGFTDQQCENWFYWTDGSPDTYTNWNPYYNEPNNNGNEDCTHFWAGSDGYWNDVSCNDTLYYFICNANTTGSRTSYPTTAPIACPTTSPTSPTVTPTQFPTQPSTKNYTLSLKTGIYEFAGTPYPVWFKLKGNNVSSSNTINGYGGYESEEWTEWFQHCCFNFTNTTFIWNQTLTNVGDNITMAIILHRVSEGIHVKEFGITSSLSSSSNSLMIFPGNNGVWLKYEGGEPGDDGCDFVRVNFVNNTYGKFDFEGDVQVKMELFVHLMMNYLQLNQHLYPVHIQHHQHMNLQYQQ